MSSYTFISICNGGNVIHISPYGAKNCTKEEDFLKSPFSYGEDEYVCVCVLKECLNLEKIGLSLISSFIRTSSKAFSTSFSKNSLMIMEPSLSLLLVLLSLSPLTMRCAIPMSFCTLQEWGKVFGHHQNFEMNDFLPTQPTNYSTNFPL